MSRRAGIARALTEQWPRVRRVLPSRHLPYPVQGGTVYLSLRNGPTTVQRLLRVYEPDKYRNIERFLPRGGGFVDVGANMGDFSLWATKCGGPDTRVLAVEVEPDNAHWLRRTLTKNGVNGQVEVVEVAASDADGETELLVAANTGQHSIVETELHTSIDAFQPVRRIVVPTRRLDDLVAESQLSRVDLIKIDVEGAERLVLGGATGLLARDEPLTILIDLHFGVDTGELGRMLQSHGFTLRTEPEPDVVIDEIPPKTLSMVAMKR